MPTPNRKIRSLIIANLSAAIFFVGLMFQHFHWPEDDLWTKTRLGPEFDLGLDIIVVLAIVVIANAAIIRGRPFQVKPRKPSILLATSIFLAAGYALGFLLIALVAIEERSWREALLLPIPIGFLVLSIRSYRRRSARLGAERQSHG